MNAPSDEDFQQHQPYLLRYALLQLRDSALAQDVVQDTLLAAIEGRARYAAKSSVKTWLTGIMKHKIIDVIRRRSREEAPNSADADAGSEVVENSFQSDGHWREMPARWGNPEQALDNRQFWEIFESCSRLLPERTARAFLLREVMELNTEEICQELAITPTNLWVMLHRARVALRECLEIKWFGAAEK